MGEAVGYSRGRRAESVQVTDVRELTLEDIIELQQPGQMKAPAIVALRERHHALARCLASGMSDAEAGAVTGYAASRISILKADPTFAGLLELYARDVHAQYLDMHRELAGLSADAVAILRERMEDDPGKIETKDLLKAAELGADRTGFGPQTKSTNLNINVNAADRLEAARRRAGLLPPPEEPVP